MAVAGVYDPADPIVKLLSDGNLIQLTVNFQYTDPSGLAWVAPKETQADGASIPRPLWSIIGSPLSGLYRNASIIHDYYCSKRSKPWRAVHQVFYDAMLTSGVSKTKALLMYSGVYMGGPRWTDMDVHNANVDSVIESIRGAGGIGAVAGPGQIASISAAAAVVSSMFDKATGESKVPEAEKLIWMSQYPINDSDVANLQREIEMRANLTPEELEEYVDRQLAGRTAKQGYDLHSALQLQEAGVDSALDQIF